MKKKICGVILAISLFLVIGIVGGIQQGEPFRNALWCFPFMGVALASAKIGGFFEEV